MDSTIIVQGADLLVVTDAGAQVIRFGTKSLASAAYDNIRSTAGYLPTDSIIRVAKLYTDEPVKSSTLSSRE